MSVDSDEARYLYYIAQMYSVDRCIDCDPLERLEVLWNNIREIKLNENETEFDVSFWTKTAREVHNLMSKRIKMSESSGLNDNFISNKVLKIISNTLSVDIEEIHLYQSLSRDLGADSLDAVDIIMELEKEFDILIPEDDAMKIRTVGDIITYIKMRR